MHTYGHRVCTYVCVHASVFMCTVLCEFMCVFVCVCIHCVHVLVFTAYVCIPVYSIFCVLHMYVNVFAFMCFYTCIIMCGVQTLTV